MADIVQLKDRTTSVEEYPVTLTEAVIDGSGNKLSALLPDFVKGPASSVNGIIAVFDGTTGKLVKSGGKTVTEICDDIANIQLALTPDTKNTVGATDTSDKIFLIGVKAQGANPQSYSHDTAYVGTDGCLYSGGAKVLTAHQSLAAYAKLASPALTGTPTAPTAASGTSTTQLATTAFVVAEINSKLASNDAMMYKTTIAGAAKASGNTYGALTPAANRGYMYKVSAAGFIDGVAVEVGDMLICNTDSTAAATASNFATIAANWDFIQTNIDGAVTGPASSVNNCIAVFDGTTGKVIKSGGKTVTELSDGIAAIDVWKTALAAAKGSSTQPVYWTAEGKPAACSYTLGKSVPSNAVFTDTNTKVTSAANHYGYVASSGATKGSNTDTISYGTTKVITGITLDDAMHVTGLKEATLPAANNYTLPTATANALGGVKIGTTLTISSGVVNVKDGAITDTKLATALSAALNVTATVVKTGVTAPTVTW